MSVIPCLILLWTSLVGRPWSLCVSTRIFSIACSSEGCAWKYLRPTICISDFILSKHHVCQLTSRDSHAGREHARRCPLVPETDAAYLANTGSDAFLGMSG